ncbi:type II secretion system (T2SS), L family protein [Yersinia rohdei]|uniref:Type II secretion system (T2SS), L family protein n=1 Tax=Yersinia rohdei TaxID=29485 RepID=A0ABM5SH38_YERRO|nr:type II secretion system protein GspL [Yersinia rohdei]AJJ12521.1 type II secretion system (T2SS), L family protein [Yersinia rohdei]CNI85692.1 general secretion pathway protein L [Yersinia rohdei]
MNILSSKITSQATLVIRFGCHMTDIIYWHLTSNDGKNEQFGRLNNPSELIDIPMLFNSDVKILVCTSQIIYRRIKLQGNKKINNLKSLRFSFEKTIVSNIDYFHTIILKTDSDCCYVAAVEHKFMQLWLGWLKDAGISTTVIIPDVLTLPFSNGQWTSVKLNNEYLIRNNYFSGFLVKDTIVEKLLLTKSHLLSEDVFICTNSQPENLQRGQSCDALRIMANNVNDSDVNLLCGRYYRYRKRVADNYFSFTRISILLLLFVVVFINSLFNKYEIENDINILNELSRGFYAKFPSVEQYDSYSQNDNGYPLTDRYNFIMYLHDSNTAMVNINSAINSIRFDNKNRTLIYNLDITNSNVTDSEFDQIDLKMAGLSMTKSYHDDDTYNIVFQHQL